MNLKSMLCIAVGLLFAPSVYAYVGPGAGLSAIGSILAFIGAILLMIVGFFWYPLKRLIKGLKKQEITNEPVEKESTTIPKDKGT